MRTETESPVLNRLSASPDDNGRPFLDKHHLAAAERLERLIARAQLRPRMTMSYDPASVRSGAKPQGHELADSAADARRLLNRLASTLPEDCWSVAVDVCGLGKGLQVVETERRWPRRSAKLVLRIALEQLAFEFGLAPHVAGEQGAGNRGWLEQRLPLIAGTDL
jgi:hypothetical protein